MRLGITWVMVCGAWLCEGLEGEQGVTGTQRVSREADAGQSQKHAVPQRVELER